MDPGNWSTDLESGTRFKYKLLFVILFSNLIAILLQHLAIRIGIYTKKNLAQVCRDQLDGKPHFWIPIYALTELAIMATDMAELIVIERIFLKSIFDIPIRLGLCHCIGNIIWNPCNLWHPNYIPRCDLFLFRNGKVGKLQSQLKYSEPNLLD